MSNAEIMILLLFLFFGENPMVDDIKKYRDNIWDSVNEYWRRRLEELDVQMQQREFTDDDILRTEKTDCLSILVDLKGTKTKLKNNMEQHIRQINRFYYHFEKWCGWRGLNLGEHMGMTFSDSFYLEVYNPEKPKQKIYEGGKTHSGREIECIFVEIFNLLLNIQCEGHVFRTYVSRGHTYRRVFQHDIILPLNMDETMKPTIIHLFGFGDCMMRVFDAESSHFKGNFFIDETLFKIVNIPFKNKGSFIAKDTGARFICIL